MSKLYLRIFFVGLIPFCLSVIPMLASAQPLSTAPAGAKPVSVSYQNLTRCFPELSDDRLSFKVDLNVLKELIDEKFVTTQSQLRQRKIQYITAEKKSMNLILRTQFFSEKKRQTELFLQQVSDNGVIVDIALTKNQRINPSQEMINNFLLGATIKADEYLYNDTKLNEVALLSRRNFKDVLEIQLEDRRLRRSVSCEKKSDLGIICTCSKK